MAQYVVGSILLSRLIILYEKIFPKSKVCFSLDTGFLIDMVTVELQWLQILAERSLEKFLEITIITKLSRFITQKKIMKKIAITGVGPISSVGIGSSNLWRGICSKKICLEKEEVIFEESALEKYFVHKVKNFSLKSFGLDQRKLQELMAWKEGEEIKDLIYIIAAIKLAVEDSKLHYSADKNKIGIVIFHENLGLGQFYHKIIDTFYKYILANKSHVPSKKDFFHFVYSKLKKSGYDLQTFSSLLHVCRFFDFHGFSLFINNACCSGLYAIEVASNMIKAGQCDCVIVAGADSPDVFKYLWFKELNLYAQDGIIRPFSRNRNGLVFGEGGSAIVLEEYGGGV